MSELNLDFEFDFHHDFTTVENRVIDEILTNSIETNGFFENVQSLIDDTQNQSSSFFEYLCNDAGSVNDLGTLDQLGQDEFIDVKYNGNQVSHEQETNSMSILATDPNVSFDWTTFLDKSSINENPIDDQQSIPDHQREIEPSPNNLIENENVIRDNGFIYQELKTLDIAQMYANLGETFGFGELRKIDEHLSYSTLPIHRQSNQLTEPTNNSNRGPLSKKKIFLMPLNLDRKSNESLHHVAESLKNHPLILNAMLQKCDGRIRSTKIRIPTPPKQIKQKSDRYLTINEQLECVNTKEVILPMIKQSTQRRKRKLQIKPCAEKVPIKYAVEMILTDINENTISHSEAVKPPKMKRTSPNSKPSKCENIEYVDESKKMRRPSKRSKMI